MFMIENSGNIKPPRQRKAGPGIQQVAHGIAELTGLTARQWCSSVEHKHFFIEHQHQGSPFLSRMGRQKNKIPG